MLRKLTQSEKNSLDLDRPAEQQDAFGIYDFGTARSAHDVSFSQIGRRGYHARSTSGASQFSTATTGSGARAGSFVHPFQQTPRPYTPPPATTSYQDSLRESEHSNNHSPALTEDDEQLQHKFRSTSNLSNHTPSLTGNTSPIIGSQPLLRIQTKQTSSSRLALAASHTSLSNSLALSPDVTSAIDTMSPTSGIRTSMEKGFRIRSRSEVDTRARSETVQEARRKFQEKEQAKDEKAAREEIRAMEKRNQKEARQIERGHRRSSASSGTRNKRSKSDLATHEKDGFIGREYGSVPFETPSYNMDGFEQRQRSNTGFSNTKKKTHNMFTKALMWIRTRFIRMGGKKKRSHSQRAS